MIQLGFRSSAWPARERRDNSARRNPRVPALTSRATNSVQLRNSGIQFQRRLAAARKRGSRAGSVTTVSRQKSPAGIRPGFARNYYLDQLAVLEVQLRG